MNGRKNAELSRNQTKQATKQSRLRQQFLSGMEAASLGFVVLGCLLLGYFLGAWLDKSLHSTIWTPILVVVGAVAGFREMIRTLMRLSKKAQTINIARDKVITKPKAAEVVQSVEGSTPTKPVIEVGQTKIAGAELQQSKPHIFKVPPPPESSFSQRDVKAQDKGDEADTAMDLVTEQEAGEAARTTNLIEKLLSDDKPSSQ